MEFSLTHAGASIITAFLASLVEFVEALTVVLAVGSVRGWRSAVTGSLAAVGVLLVLVVVLGSAVTRIRLDVIQTAIGILLLLFGMRWLRKAILRAAGVTPLHDETAAYAKEAEAMRRLGLPVQGWDRVAIAASFQIIMLEGTEVVFIVVAIGAGSSGLLLPASVGAVAALLLVVALGLALHRPLASVPENTLKFAVGVLLSGFGTFWIGEGMGLPWPGADWSILGLVFGFLATGLATVPVARRRAAARLRTAMR